MLFIFREEKLITAVMLFALLLSIVSRIIIGVLYQNMIKETDNMSTTANKLLKQCKMKFANCYQLNMGVSNIPIFVDKFLNRITLGPFTLQTIYHLSGQFMLLSVFFAGVGICKSIIEGRTLGQILPFYIVSFFGLYIYFSVSAVVDIKGKRRVLKVNLIDYLENHMVNRLHSVEEDEKRLAKETEEQQDTAEKKSVKSGFFTKTEEKELEELLKEFLV